MKLLTKIAQSSLVSRQEDWRDLKVDPSTSSLHIAIRIALPFLILGFRVFTILYPLQSVLPLLQTKAILGMYSKYSVTAAVCSVVFPALASIAVALRFWARKFTSIPFAADDYMIVISLVSKTGFGITAASLQESPVSLNQLWLPRAVWVVQGWHRTTPRDNDTHRIL